MLGLKWLSVADQFSYTTSKPSEKFTKRTVLSAIAQIYDPLGWVTPVVFFAKAIMQHLWTLGLQWDDPLPVDVSERWLTFIEELPFLEQIVLPRHLDTTNAIRIDLLGFSDASTLGYAASTYLRVEKPNKDVSVYLLLSKSRVAPLKRISLPRLELCGAHLLAQLLKYSSEQLLSYLSLNSITAFSDSTITLAWIQTPAYRLKTYVSNRVSQIQDLMPTCVWKHVSSQDNPADPASRGLTASNLLQNEIWFNGPHWLKLSPSAWPNSSGIDRLQEEELPDIRPHTLNLMTQTVESEEPTFLTKFSSWTTLLHVMGYILRFISCLKNKNRLTHSFTRKELKQSNDRICYLIQRSSFKSDIELLEKNKICSNRIQRLTPFLDEDGMLRVGGRLRHSNLPFEAKHQIILPKNHLTVHLLIDHYHKANLHAGTQLLQSILQEQYWILAARSTIRFRIFRCIQCFKTKPRPNFPLMADLPSGRVIPARCFAVCGVDYAGPYRVTLYRLRKLQPIKVYLCLFICFTSKAVHLEVVTDLSSDAFIASLTRFISRRGLVSDLYSDCGTNFIGTASSLKKTFQDLMRKPETRQFAEGKQVNFHFIPPRSPHQGGLWERAIKSAKYHLTRVIGAQVLTYEEFITLTTRVEAMLNSRPISPLSSDPNDFLPLTPGHFITGGPLTSLIEPCLTNATPTQRWKMVQSFAQHIWTRWQKEYLQTLQTRSKWDKPGRNLKIGDLVLIHEDNTPPLSWRVGRITSTSPGKDNIVRVVHINTGTKSLTRPAVKVSLLPID